MQLGLYIAGHASIHGQAVSLDGLTVLFGANSSGKSNILDAISMAIGGHSRDVDDLDLVPGQPDPEWGNIELIVSFRADERDSLERLHLRHEGPQGRSYVFGPGKRAELASVLTGAEMVEALVEALAAGDIGERSDRVLVARELASSRRVVVDTQGTALVALRCDFSDAALAAAERIAAAALGAPGNGDGDRLVDACNAIEENARYYVERLGGSWDEDDYWLSGPLVVDLVPDGLGDAIRQAIDQADETLGRPTSREGSWDRWRSLVRSLGIPSGFDHWLEEQPSAVSPERPAAVEARYQPNVWARVRPTIIALAGEIEARANELAPPFVREHGDIVIAVLGPSVWEHHGRLRIAVRDRYGHVRSLRGVGSGMARWVAATLRLAAADIAGAQWRAVGAPIHYAEKATVVETDCEVPHDLIDESAEMIASAAELGDLRAAVVPVFPARLDDVVLVDEPEAHLHPAAVRDVVEWLRQLSLRTNCVVVATHHPLFLSLSADEASLVFVRRDEQGTELRRLTTNDLEELDGAADEVGLSRADLLQNTRLVVFVEGPHDEAVLTAMVGQDLRRARVLLLPLHGVDNALSLVHAELVHRLGIPMAVVADNGGLKRGKSREADHLGRLVKEMRQEGRAITVYGLDKRDILDYLNDDVCRDHAPDFPGWTAAAGAWRSERPVDHDGQPLSFKRFVTRRYGLKLDRRSVAELARKTAERQRVPGETLRLAKQLTAHASGQPPIDAI